MERVGLDLAYKMTLNEFMAEMPFGKNFNVQIIKEKNKMKKSMSAITFLMVILLNTQASSDVWPDTWKWSWGNNVEETDQPQTNEDNTSQDVKGLDMLKPQISSSDEKASQEDSWYYWPKLSSNELDHLKYGQMIDEETLIEEINKVFELRVSNLTECFGHPVGCVSYTLDGASSSLETPESSIFSYPALLASPFVLPFSKVKKDNSISNNLWDYVVNRREFFYTLVSSSGRRVNGSCIVTLEYEATSINYMDEDKGLLHVDIDQCGERFVANQAGQMKDQVVATVSIPLKHEPSLADQEQIEADKNSTLHTHPPIPSILRHQEQMEAGRNARKRYYQREIRNRNQNQ